MGAARVALPCSCDCARSSMLSPALRTHVVMLNFPCPHCSSVPLFAELSAPLLLCDSFERSHLAHEVDAEGEVVRVDERHDCGRLLHLRAPRKVLRAAGPEVTQLSEKGRVCVVKGSQGAVNRSNLQTLHRAQ